MSFKNITIFACLLLFLQNAFAQNSPEDIGEKFFELYNKYGSDRALDYLFSTNKYAKESEHAIAELKNNLRRTSEAIGSFRGYELLVKKTAGQSVVMLTFIAKHDRDPLTFRMLFYKPVTTWQVQNFKFDNKIDEELEKASKTF